MVVELLNRRVSKAEFYRLLEGFAPLNGGLSIPFIQFANDFLLLLETIPEVIENLRGMLLILEGVSSLKVNLRKSSMAPVGDVQNLRALAFNWLPGCFSSDFLPRFTA